MQCPYCGSNALKVLDTADTKSGIRRRRECTNCTQRFTTYERSITATPMLIKGDGIREEFDREKLKRGIWNACAKRPIPAAEVERLTNQIEVHLQSLGRAEVSSRVVGDMVIEGLKVLDPIAYIRYAIVYLGLDNLQSIRSEIDRLLADEIGGTTEQEARSTLGPSGLNQAEDAAAPTGTPDDSLSKGLVRVPLSGRVRRGTPPPTTYSQGSIPPKV